MEGIAKTIQEETATLLDKAGIKASIDIKQEEESFKVHIDADENALLIGKHGNTLSSLELVLSLIISKKTGEFNRLIIEIDGYREAREEYLKDLAERLREEVIATGTEKVVGGLKPWERRTIHMHLSENPDVSTESEGEERERVLVIKKK